MILVLWKFCSPHPSAFGCHLLRWRRLIGDSMIYNYNKRNVSIARTLRKNMTREEKRLWYDFLKTLPITVNRQKPIGNYIVDFFIARERIVIEIDGSQHYEEENRLADKKRDEDFNKIGIKVLRYTNAEINTNFQGVCEDILKNLAFPCGEGGPR